MTDNGMELLIENIILRAAKDYKKEYITDSQSRETKKLERWFAGKWCQHLTGGIDPEKILNVLKMQAKYEEWRRVKKCNYCRKEKYETCIHRSGTHYTAVERGELICPKEAGDGGGRN